MSSADGGGSGAADDAVIGDGSDAVAGEAVDAPGGAPTADGAGALDDASADAGDDVAEGPGALALPTDPAMVRAGLEALLMVVDEPAPDTLLAEMVERPLDEVRVVLAELAESYANEGRGFELRHVAGGWRFYTRADCAPYVERFVREGQQARLTQAALETLAVVAYRQPVTRGRISAIRGVNVDAVVRTLTTRGLIAEAGTDPESGAVLYVTTDYFLERLGINDLSELPQLAPLLPDIESLDNVDA